MHNTDELVGFLNHMDLSTEEMLDILNDGNYQDRFDFTVSMNGKSVTIPNNADVYCIFEQMFVELIAEYYRENEARLRNIASMQMMAPDRLQIIFKFHGRKVLNPFQGFHRREYKGVVDFKSTDPLDYYGKAFLKSNWMNEKKVDRLEKYLLANRLIK